MSFICTCLFSLRYDAGEGKMSIDHVNPADEGWYRCNGTNAYGTDEATVQLLVSVDGDWSSWSSYAECSGNCDGGTQTRTRRCDNPERRNKGQDCQGDSEEVLRVYLYNFATFSLF